MKYGREINICIPYYNQIGICAFTLVYGVYGLGIALSCKRANTQEVPNKRCKVKSIFNH